MRACGCSSPPNFRLAQAAALSSGFIAVALRLVPNAPCYIAMR